MTPFHLALSVSQAMTEAFFTGSMKWASTVCQTTANAGADWSSARAEDVHCATGRPARSWYRKPAPTWPEVAQSYGWPQSFMSVAMPTTAFMSPLFAGTAFDPTRQLHAGLALQTQVLQSMLMPLQSMMGGAASSGEESPTASTAFPRMQTQIVSSDQRASRGDVAIASITLPDKTVFEITVPMPSNAQPFWPWAGPFGGSSYATPPNGLADDNTARNGLDHDVLDPDKALTASMRRSYLRGRDRSH